MKYAVIDIGSNSVRLMLWADGKSFYKRLSVTRLGSGLAESGMLSKSAMERTQQAVLKFCKEGRNAGAEVLAFATAAVRSAQNGADFCARVKAACGVCIDVISGENEAKLGLLGALGRTNDGGILDIGGASTELCLRQNGEIIFSKSIPLGAVRLYDTCHDDERALLNTITEVASAFDGAAIEGTIYAVGGTASTLASIKLGLNEYDGTRLQGLPLSRDWVQKTASNLLALPIEQRKKIAGMDPLRADIIAGGAFLMGILLEKLDCDRILFSDCDNLEGYLYFRGLA